MLPLRLLTPPHRPSRSHVCRQVSRFYYELLIKQTILKPSSVALMTQFSLLNEGWRAGQLSYGMGLMTESTEALSDDHPELIAHVKNKNLSSASWVGHGGVTFGFVSDQGVYADMANASFSVVLNSDMQEAMGEQELATTVLVCRVQHTWARVHLGLDLEMPCTM